MAVITGTSGNDTLNGTSSSDQIYGLGGDDTLNGGGGNDTLDGGTGADTMSGGTGNDIYIVDDSGDSVIEAAGQGNDEIRTILAAYTLGANVEKLRFTGTGSFTGTGNDLANHIYGGASADTLSGGDGYDYLFGSGGDDSLYGGNDGDTLEGGTGADYMEGNGGNDVYIVDSTSDTVVELSGEGTDQVYTTLTSYTLGADVENLNFNLGGGIAFHCVGNGLANVIHGQSCTILPAATSSTSRAGTRTLMWAATRPSPSSEVPPSPVPPGSSGPISTERTRGCRAT
jgi:Ca2+-binding RTX toxin-like protein